MALRAGITHEGWRGLISRKDKLLYYTPYWNKLQSNLTLETLIPLRDTYRYIYIFFYIYILYILEMGVYYINF